MYDNSTDSIFQFWLEKGRDGTKCYEAEAARSSWLNEKEA
jgi:hypothetical protein